MDIARKGDPAIRRRPDRQGSNGRRETLLELGATLAGPALITLAVLIVLHRFWFAARLTNQHVDLLAQWFPRWCYLGRSLRAGQIPTWLPYQFSGYPFASDPQSGWLYAPVMVLFSFLSCSRALGLVIVSHPLVAGLGFYLFLRNEELGRPAATVGGLTLSLSMAASVMVLTMPFAATLAWTSVTLAGASGLLRAGRHRLAWLAFASFGLTQVATAHLTNGLVMAAIVLALYFVATVAMQVRLGERSLGSALARVGAFILPFPVLAAAVLLPRVAYLPRTSLGHGYLELARIASRLSGKPAPAPFASRGVSVWWGTSFARGPTGYVGVLAIVLIVLAFTSRRWRYPAAAFALAGFIGWLLNMDALIRNQTVRRFALKTQMGELWLRDPQRFQYLLLLAFAAMAGYGLQAWIEQASAEGRRAVLRRALWLGPPLVVFLVAPLLAGSRSGPYAFLIVASTVALPLLLAVASGRRALILALPLVVAIELTLAGLIDQVPASTSALVAPKRSSDARFMSSFGRLRSPSIDPAAYMTPGPIGRRLIQAKADFGRYLTFDPNIARTPRGFLAYQDPAHWPAYENGRSILFGIDEIQGYLPVQVDRYWHLVRKFNPLPIFYNAATFQVAPPGLLRLFGVEWVVVPTGLPAPTEWMEAANEGQYTLYRLRDAEPRASMVYQWRQVTPDIALADVVEAGFDPAHDAILETRPEIGGHVLHPGPSPHGDARYTESSPEQVIVRVDGTSDGLLVVRNVNDKNWHATVDGRPAPLLAADYLMQAVPVPAGEHLVELRYRDQAIGLGILISAVGWCALLVVALVFATIEQMHRTNGRGP